MVDGKTTAFNEVLTDINGSSIETVIDEIYLDGKLKSAQLIDDSEKSYGIFMHSLILSNFENSVDPDNDELKLSNNETEKAISSFFTSKGFNKGVIDSIAPRIAYLTFENENVLKVSTHKINEKLRIVTRGMPELLVRRCAYILAESKFIKLTRRIVREINDAIKNMVNRGLSVFALAIKDLSAPPECLDFDIIANDMALVALVGVGKNYYSTGRISQTMAGEKFSYRPISVKCVTT